MVEVEPIRMATIKLTNTGEKKALISEAEFRGNIILFQMEKESNGGD